ncbi:MAG: polymer-forming cytoskeletal protein [Phycisphaeraceae bacterium]
MDATVPTTELSAPTRIDGELTIQGRVIITGRFQGTLCTDDTIVIGPTGIVIGTLIAPRIEVAGRVEGVIQAAQLTTHAGATLVGEMRIGVAVEDTNPAEPVDTYAPLDPSSNPLPDRPAGPAASTPAPSAVTTVATVPQGMHFMLQRRRPMKIISARATK